MATPTQRVLPELVHSDEDKAPLHPKDIPADKSDLDINNDPEVEIRSHKENPPKDRGNQSMTMQPLDTN